MKPTATDIADFETLRKAGQNYVAPVAKAFANAPLAEEIRSRLSAICAQFKDCTDKIRFLYITGVSKSQKHGWKDARKSV